MLEKYICVKDINFLSIDFCVVELIKKYSEYTWEKAQCLIEKDGANNDIKKYKEKIQKTRDIWNAFKCQSRIYLK